MGMALAEEQVLVTNVSNRMMDCGNRILVPGQPTRVDLDFFFKFQNSWLKYDFSRLQDTLAVINDHGDLIIDWRSPLSSIDGYGRHAIWMIRALVQNGVDLAVRHVGWSGVDFTPPDIQALQRYGTQRLPARIGITFTLGYDPQLYDHSSPLKIGITQFETDKLPAKHVENVNRLDHVIVTSSFQVRSFRRSGVHVPITVLLPSVPVAEFPYVERAMDGKFKVLMLGALTERKNPLGAVRIFQQASRGNPDWSLTIKTRPDAPGTRDVARAIHSDPRIKLIARDEAPEAVNNYYATHDCLLWPSKGEGVGLPPLEALCTGMEVVCSDNSGMSDFVDSGHCWPIKMRGQESAAGPGLFTKQYVDAYGDVGFWWTPNESHGARQLERCFNAWRDGMGKGRIAAEYVRRNHDIRENIKVVIGVARSLANAN